MAKDRREIIKCPRCNEVMIFDRENEFWKCPACEGEFWPKVEFDQAKLPPALVDKMVKRIYQEEVRTGYVLGIKKKGRSRSGRKRKKLPKKSSEWARRFVEV